MKALNPQDQDSLQEIASIGHKMHAKINLAKSKEINHLWFEAKKLYREAQNLSLHAGKDLKVKIMSEPCDFENWHRLNKKIEALKIKLPHN